MSYNPLKREDSLNELIGEIIDCKQICNMILKTKNDFNSCMNWFMKSLKVNKRQTYLFIKDNLNSFTKEELEFFNQFFNFNKYNLIIGDILDNE